MYCKNCGKEIDDDSKFCQYCGVEQSKKETGTYTEPKVNNTPKHKTCSICGQTNETVQDYHVSGATHTADGSIGKLLDGGIYLCSACAKECPKCEGIIITPQIKQLLDEFKIDWNADEVDIFGSCECAECKNDTQDNSNIYKSPEEGIEKCQKNLTLLKKIIKFILIIITIITIVIVFYLAKLVSYNYSASKIDINNINISENYPNGKPKIKSIYDKENHQTIISSYHENGKLDIRLFVDEKPLDIIQVMKNILDFNYIRYGYIPYGSGIKVHKLQYYKTGNLSLDCSYILYENTNFFGGLERIFTNEINFNHNENILTSGYRRFESSFESYYDATHQARNFEVFNGKIYDGKELEKISNIKERYQYKNGHRNGVQYEFYENGSIKNKYYFKNNIEVGVLTSYYPNGSKRKTVDYKKGFHNRIIKTYYPNENLRSEYSYKKYKLEGKVEGKYIEYYENGNMKYVINYQKGKPVSGTMYDEENNPTIMTNANLNNSKFLEF